MKNKLITLIISATVFCGCEKSALNIENKYAVPNWKTATTYRREIVIGDPVTPISPADPAPILPPGQTEYCIPNLTEFYAYVWSLQNGPAVQCPYTSYALKTVTVTFTDGTVINCGPTVINQFGTVGQGGIGLQDISCTAPTGGFLTYIILTYYESLGGQGSATFPLYSCDYNANGYPTGYGEIRILKGGITYIVHSTITTFSYPSQGAMITKTVKQIEFVL